jgi:hypothetical protein
MTTKYKVFVAKRVTKTPELALNDGIFFLKCQFVLTDANKSRGHLSSAEKRREILYIIKPSENEVLCERVIDKIWIR